MARVIRATTIAINPMQITHGQLYHVYNRGNNQQRIFYSPQHYFYFIEKLKAHLGPVADVLAWCLMPNHYHFLLQLHEAAEPQRFSSALRVLLSSYTRSVNKERGWNSSFFSITTILNHSIPAKVIPTSAFSTYIGIRLGQAW